MFSQPHIFHTFSSFINRMNLILWKMVDIPILKETKNKVEMPSSSGQQITAFNFPKAERREFECNFLDTVVIELRYPTYLPLKEREPIEISAAIRNRFPLYEAGNEIQVTPSGATDPQPVYKFATRTKDPVITISTSSLILETKKYRSFEDFSSYILFLIQQVIPCLDTTFFTRIGLRYINHISGIQKNGMDILDWINHDLVKPVGGGVIGAISNMKNELTGPLPEEGGYTFRYGLLPPSSKDRKFILDWDYYIENVEVTDCMERLVTFHHFHFPFFWWALGEKARDALQNGTAKT